MGKEVSPNKEKIVPYKYKYPFQNLDKNKKFMVSIPKKPTSNLENNKETKDEPSSSGETDRRIANLI